MLVAAVGQALLRRAERSALLVDAQITCEPERPARRHLVGAATFGHGWGIADAQTEPATDAPVSVRAVTVRQAPA